MNRLIAIPLAMAIASTPALSASCDRMVADDYKALTAATKRLQKACAKDTMSESCTKAIEWGDKVSAASDALEAKCPKVTWSYDPPPPWEPEE